MCRAVWCNVIIITILVSHIFINIIVIFIILIIILITDFVWLFRTLCNFLFTILYFHYATPHTSNKWWWISMRKHFAPMRVESHYELPRWTNFHCCCHCKSAYVLNGDWHMRHLLRVFRFRGTLCYRKIKCVFNENAGCGILLSEHISTMFREICH
jgi:hypothetical protein